MSVAAPHGSAEIAAALARAGGQGAEVALVLGSGLGAFADRLEDATAVPFEDVAGMPASTVPGHAGRFVIGTCAGVRVIVQQGRVHLYEGHTARDVTRSVRAFAELGCRALVLTNAAGGLVADWPAPCLMRIEDHLNLTGRTPLARSQSGFGSPWDAGVGAALDSAFQETGVELRRGVYAGLLGPSYETPAEVRLLASYGAHAVGMSTALEALAGCAAGMRVGGVSCITNPGAGISRTPLSHDEVVAAGRAIADDFCRLLEAAVPRILKG